MTRTQVKEIRRRAFIGRMAMKAAYITPAVVALKASRKSYAGVSGCGQTGSPCLTDTDCCGGFACVKPNMMACAAAMNCTCQ